MHASAVPHSCVVGRGSALAQNDASTSFASALPSLHHTRRSWLPTPHDAEQMPQGDAAQVHACVLHASVDEGAVKPEAAHRSLGTAAPDTGSTHTVVRARVPPLQGALHASHSVWTRHRQLALLHVCCVGGLVAAVQSDVAVADPAGVTHSTTRVCEPPGPHGWLHVPHAPARHWFG
jgi:hypothetical protein